MTNIAYVNGRYIPIADATVHIEDRGYQFADGIYEYIAFYNRKLMDEELHLKRLVRSLKEVSIPMPRSPVALLLIMRELIDRNVREHGGLYMQVTRGVARRDHAFPKQAVKPALTMTICAAKFPKPQEMNGGVRVITHPDQRWARRDIKSVSLLANVLAKQEAAAHKAREAWLLEGNRVIEGTASNAYIVNQAGELITHPADQHILGGITRDVVLRLAKKAGIRVAECAFTLDEVKQAAEAFITSTSINVLPVVEVDDIRIGGGKPGEVTRKLQALCIEHIYEQTGFQWAP